MAVREFKLPDPGEGLTEADIVTWHVAVGDTVKVNDVVVEIETAKSLVELPIPFSGTVHALLVAEGDTVEVGTVIISVDDGEGGPAPAAGGSGAADGSSAADGSGAAGGGSGSGSAAGDQRTDEGAQEQGSGEPKREPVLVGYGVKHTEAKRRPRRKDALKQTVAHEPAEDEAREVHAHDQARVGELAAEHSTHVLRDTRPLDELAGAQARTGEQVRVLAKPPVRKLAKDLGVDLATVRASGEGGTITRDDVHAAAGGGDRSGAAEQAGPAAQGGHTAYGQAASGDDRPAEERIPVKGVRKVTAQAMVASAFTAPHVTEWVTVDVTATMELIERLKGDREFRDVKVTPLLVLAKAMCLAVRRNPDINATWDEANREIVRKRYVNLGIAAATPRGLMVPNIKSAERLSLRELADAIAELTATAREGRTPPADMSGGTITITNVGVFGVDSGTPILNPGESAILAFGAIRRMPWVVGSGADERVEPRWVTQLALSFDHRLVDGELGSRYLADVAAVMADPTRGLVWG